MKCFRVVCVELSSDSQGSRILLITITIESAHCAFERNMYRDWAHIRYWGMQTHDSDHNEQPQIWMPTRIVESK